MEGVGAVTDPGPEAPSGFARGLRAQLRLGELFNKPQPRAFPRLRSSEADKVRCGQKHFEALGVPFEVGRPTGLRSGASQRFQIAGPAAPEIPVAGRYIIQCAIDGEVIGHTAIEVVAASPAASG